MLFVTIVVFAAHGVFVIFASFFKPLLWAVLGGAALHQLKGLLVHGIEAWLDGLYSVAR